MLITFNALEQTTPVKQFLLVFPTALLAMAFAAVVSSNAENAWFISSAALGFYVWMNAVLGFFKKTNFGGYVGQSFGLFLVMGILLVASASWVSGLSLSGLREYKIMLLATFVFYVCGILISAIIRNVAILMEIHY